MNLVVIINGSGTAGKDTVVDIVKEKLDNSFVYNVSSIDIVRQAARLLGWNDESKTDHDREFLHQMKMLASKFYNHSFWYMLGKHEWHTNIYYDKIDSRHLVGFFHVREPEEIEKFKKAIQNRNCPVLTLLVRRDNINKFTNDADKNVENYKYDYVIENDGTIEDLEDVVIELFNNILKGNA